MNNKIVHVSTVHSAFDTRIFHKECVSLKNAGYEVYLVVRHDKDEVKEGVNILSLPTSRNRLHRILVRPFLALKRALSTQASIFHFHDPELIPIGFILRCLGKKVIYDVHEDFPRDIFDKYWIPQQLKPVVSNIANIFESVSARLLSGIVAATPNIQDRFIKYNKNTICVTNYPILDEAQIGETIQREPYSIAYVGGITKERGILEILDAIEGTNVKLYLAGTFSPSSLESLCRSKAGWNNVEYLGFLNRKGVFSLLQEVRVGLLTLYPTPNYILSYPVKMYEYMLAGLPIVLSNISHWQSLLEGINCTKFVDPLNPQEIREAILDLLNHPEEAEKMGKSGQKAVLERFNWDHEVKKLIDFFKKLSNSE